jgi:ribosomal protein S15P/S13E
MPCYKCANGKYKYGTRGNCQFDTLTKCKEAELAILIDKMNKIKESINKNNKDYGKS